MGGWFLGLWVRWLVLGGWVGGWIGWVGGWIGWGVGWCVAQNSNCIPIALSRKYIAMRNGPLDI